MLINWTVKRESRNIIKEFENIDISSFKRDLEFFGKINNFTSDGFWRYTKF